MSLADIIAHADLTDTARALLAAATPGPWQADAWYGCDDGGWAAIGPHHMATEDEGYDDVPESPAHHRAMADAALIAAAPELIAALCDEVERLRARKARLCDSCLGWGLARLDGSKEPCPACGRAGAVIVEGEK